MITKEQYAQAFKQLMPLGMLFDLEESSNFYKLIIAICANYELFDEYCDNFINEIYPNTTLELLPEWEREYGLPDSCSIPDSTIEQRRKLLLAKYNALGGQTPAYYIALAAYLGYAITIIEFADFAPFRTNINRTNDVLYGESWQWVWQVNCNLFNPAYVATPNLSTANEPLYSDPNIIYFRTNISTTNTPLIQWGDNAEQVICFINKYKPAHTYVLYDFFVEW